MCDLKICIKDDRVLEVIRQAINKYRLIEKDETVLCALSGGADSVCLLVCLSRLAEEMGFSLLAAHVNHGIRGDEAARDEAYCQILCNAIHVPLFTAYIDVPALSRGRSEEEVGREERYAFFYKLCEERGIDKIAVAHNKNDDVETVFLRLLRGSSVFGLGGISRKNGNIIRPLLDISRAEIEEYLSRCGIAYMTDSTNQSDAYMRNFVRHNILSKLEYLNKDYLDTIQRTAKRIKETAEFIEQAARRDYGEITPVLDVKKLAILPKPLAEYVAANGAYLAGVKEISQKQLEALLSLVQARSGKRIQLSRGYTVQRVYDTLVFLKEEESVDYCVKLSMGDTYIEEADYTVSVKKAKRGIDKAKIRWPLYARPRKEKDTIRPVGMTGEKKIKALYIDDKLPLTKRKSYPLIISDDKVIYALGRCSSDVVSDDTTLEAITIEVSEGMIKK